MTSHTNLKFSDTWLSKGLLGSEAEDEDQTELNRMLSMLIGAPRAKITVNIIFTTSITNNSEICKEGSDKQSKNKGQYYNGNINEICALHVPRFLRL